MLRGAVVSSQSRVHCVHHLVRWHWRYRSAISSFHQYIGAWWFPFDPLFIAALHTLPTSDISCNEMCTGEPTRSTFPSSMARNLCRRYVCAQLAHWQQPSSSRKTITGKSYINDGVPFVSGKSRRGPTVQKRESKRFNDIEKYFASSTDFPRAPLRNLLLRPEVSGLLYPPVRQLVGVDTDAVYTFHFDRAESSLGCSPNDAEV